MISFYCIVLFNIILLCQSYNINSNSKRINFNNAIKGISNNRNLRIYLRTDDDNDDNDNNNDDDFDGTFEERINKKYNKRYPSKSKRSTTNVNSNSNIPFLFGLNRWEVIPLLCIYHVIVNYHYRL
jgi:hypothetical protein